MQLLSTANTQGAYIKYVGGGAKGFTNFSKNFP